MPKKNFIPNLCFGCIAGIYLGIILFATLTSLFFQSYYKGTELLGGYGVAIVVGALIGLIFVFCYTKLKGNN